MTAENLDVRPAMEPVITFHRIERSSSTGIHDHFRPEHAHDPRAALHEDLWPAARAIGDGFDRAEGRIVGRQRAARPIGSRSAVVSIPSRYSLSAGFIHFLVRMPSRAKPCERG